MSVWLTAIPTCLGCPSTDWWMGIHVYLQAVKYYIIYYTPLQSDWHDRNRVKIKMKWYAGCASNMRWIATEKAKKKKKLSSLWKKRWMETMEVGPAHSFIFLFPSVFFPLACIKEWERAEKHWTFLSRNYGRKWLPSSKNILFWHYSEGWIKH